MFSAIRAGVLTSKVSIESARYWRIVGVGAPYYPGLGMFMQASEIYMYESSDATGTDLCIGSTAIASSTGQGSAPIVNNGVQADSGNGSSEYWSTAFNEVLAWWGIDLGAGISRPVRSLKFQPRWNYGTAAPRTAKLQSSTDYSTWIDVGAVFDFAYNSDPFYTRTVTNIQ